MMRYLDGAVLGGDLAGSGCGPRLCGARLQGPDCAVLGVTDGMMRGL